VALKIELGMRVAAVVWIFVHLLSLDLSLAHLAPPSFPSSLSFLRGGNTSPMEASTPGFARGGGNVEMRKKFEKLCRDAQVREKKVAG
jgi:hypothetical protein